MNRCWQLVPTKDRYHTTLQTGSAQLLGADPAVPSQRGNESQQPQKRKQSKRNSNFQLFISLSLLRFHIPFLHRFFTTLFSSHYKIESHLKKYSLTHTLSLSISISLSFREKKALKSLYFTKKVHRDQTRAIRTRFAPSSLEDRL